LYFEKGNNLQEPPIWCFPPESKSPGISGPKREETLPQGETLSLWDSQSQEIPEDEGSLKYEKIDDRRWSRTFGDAQKKLSNHTVNKEQVLVLDFSKVEWIYPLPLLGILTVIKGFCTRTGCPLLIRLGVNQGSSKKRYGFIKFLFFHGFIAAMYHNSYQASVSLDDLEEPIVADLLEQKNLIIEKIAGHTLMYPDSRCLNASLIDVSSQNNSVDIYEQVSNMVERYLAEIRNYGLNQYNDDEEYVNDILHKIRIILSEILLNAFEHAYRKQSVVTKYFAIYARFRKDVINQQADVIRAEEADCPYMRPFSSRASPWIEIFYCDNGVGLCADLKDWKKNADQELRKKLESVKPQTNILLQLSRYIFHETISRHNREKNNKTALTGFQHIKYALNENSDFVRIYSEGEWIGATFPWTEDKLGSSENLKKLYPNDKDKHHSGTVWHFCIGLDQDSKTKIDMNEWPNKIKAEDIENNLLTNSSSSDLEIDWEISKWMAFDKINSSDQNKNWKESLEESQPESVTSKVEATHPADATPSAETHGFRPQFIWLPNTITKHYVAKWLERVQKTEIGGCWIVADLSRSEVRTLKSIIDSEINKGDSIKFPGNLNIIIITVDWYVVHYKSCRNDLINESYCLINQTKESTQEIEIVEKHGKDIFSLLRSHDSKLFWDEIFKDIDNSVKNSFVPERVVWERDRISKEASIYLVGYLDLTHALVNTRCKLIAARSLRRTWYLFTPDAICEEADELLTDLLPREARRLKNKGDERIKVIVSSVLVTGSTIHNRGIEVEEIKQEPGTDNTIHNRSVGDNPTAIHLLRHSWLEKIEDGRYHRYIPKIRNPERFALNWVDDERVEKILKQNKDMRQYERIPGTPYISRGGQKAIPVRRFYRRGKDEKEYFRRSIYAEEPKKAYDRFLQLELMKLGHWVYGGHHNLIELNLGLAVKLDSFERGPIFSWICTELNKSNSTIVVYPAHSVTEKLVQAIQKYFNSDKHFIPIHFLGKQHVQTSIRIPSLTYDRIKSLLKPSEEATSKNFKPEPIVILDDGVLTGKVQRELEQLIRNAGAKEVIHISIINRTGLPLYRNYLTDKDYEDHYRFYWRWDVPPLGSARTCPLCRAIEQSNEAERTLRDKSVKARIKDWTDNWLERSVITDWWRSGLKPGNLPEPRPLTFGKEWESTGEVTDKGKYKIMHTTTTGLASSVVELIRVTSYKEVGIKLAKKPWFQQGGWNGDEMDWRRARLEILASQTFLFFDDFSDNELVTRFSLILGLLSSSGITEDFPIDCLACLTLMLSTEKQARDVVYKIVKWIFNKSLDYKIYSEDFKISLSFLMRRSKLTPDDIVNRIVREPREPEERVLKYEMKNFLRRVRILTVGHEIPKNTHALLLLTLLLGDTPESTHTGVIQKRLSEKTDNPKWEIVANELEEVINAFEMIPGLALLSSPDHSSNDKDQLINDTKNLLDEVKKASKNDRARLYNRVEEIAGKFRHIFFESVEAIINKLDTRVDNNLIESKIRSCNDQDKNRIKERVGNKLPKFDITLQISDSEKGKIVVCPPAGWQMITDELLNYLHSPCAYQNGKDIKCHLSVHKNMLRIEIRNLVVNGSNEKGSSKYAEIIYRQHFFRNLEVERKLSDNPSEMIVVLEMPFIQRLFELS